MAKLVSTELDEDLTFTGVADQIDFIDATGAKSFLFKDSVNTVNRLQIAPTVIQFYGQTLAGDTGVDGLLILRGNTNATPNTNIVQLGTTTGKSGYDAINHRLGLQTLTPTEVLHLAAGNIYAATGALKVAGTGNSYVMGSLGIGTTGPATLLELGDVAGVAGKGQLFINGQNAVTDGLYVDRTIANEYAWFNDQGGIATIGTRGGAAAHGVLRLVSTNDGTTLATRIYIDTTGNLGIGTTGPGTTLDVHGTVAFNPSDGAVDSHFFTASDGAGTYFIRDGSANDDIKFTTVTNAASYINNGGNVGIGTTGPSSKLDVTVTAVGNSVDNTEGLSLVNTTAAIANVTGDDGQQYSPALRWRGQGWKTDVTAASQPVDFRAYVIPIQGAAAPTGKLAFQAAVNGAAYTDLFTVLSSGKMGFGTLSPHADSRFHFYDNTAAAGGMQIRWENAGTGQVDFIIQRSGGTTAQWDLYIPSGSTDLRYYNATAGDLLTLTVAGGLGVAVAPTSTERMHIQSSDTKNTLFVENTGGGGDTKPALDVLMNANSGARVIGQFRYSTGTALSIRDDNTVAAGTATPATGMTLTINGHTGPASAGAFDLGSAANYFSSLFASNGVFRAGSDGTGSLVVGLTSPHASAALHVESTTKAFLPPRMTTTQRNAITAIAGLTIYNTTDNQLQYHNGTSWVAS